jgi:hypothetical protein
MVKEGLKNVAAGQSISIKLGMEKATQYLVTQINEFVTWKIFNLFNKYFNFIRNDEIMVCVI